MSLHSSVVWRGLKHHEKSHRKRGEKRFCLAVKKKIHLQKKSSKFWGTLPPPKKKRKTSLIYDSSTSNLVLQHRQCTTETLRISPLSQWFPMTFSTVVHPEGADPPPLALPALAESRLHSPRVCHGKWLPPTYSTSFLCFFFQPWKFEHNDFLRKFKKKQQNCNTETQEKDILKSLNPENYSLIFSNSKIYKFLPKRKASVLVVFTLFKKQTLESPGFFYQNKRPEPPNQTTRKIDKIH